MKKKFKRAVSIVLTFVLVLSLSNVVAYAGSELPDRTGYTISYHNNHNWSEWGGSIDGCDNSYSDSTGRQCKQFLVPILTHEYVFNWNYGLRKWSGDAPTSANDSRWAECLAEYGSYMMPLSIGGCAFLCTDDTVWYIKPEEAYIGFWGDKAGVAFYNGYNSNNPAQTAGKQQHARIYYVQPSVGDCTDSKNYKYLKGVGYYYYSDGDDGGHSFEWGRYFNTDKFKSNNFNIPGESNECYDDSNYFRRWFSGYNVLENYEIKQYTTTPGESWYGCPSYGLVSKNLTFKGVTSGLGPVGIYWESDGSIHVYDSTVGGFELKNHDEYMYRYKCGGHYSANTYTVRYNGNGHTSGSTASTSCTYDVTSYVSSNGFEKTGYKFSHWNTKSDNTGTSYNPNDPIVNWRSDNGGVFDLYAIWTPITYQVQYNKGVTNN